MHSLRYVRAPMLLTKSPTLVCPNFKLSKSIFHLSSISISNSYSHFVYSQSSNFKNISITNFQFSFFISQPIFIHSEDECEIVGERHKENRILYREDGESSDIINLCHGSFTDSFTDLDINRGHSCGGAISCQGSSLKLTLTDILFKNCRCVIQGGAIMIYLAKSVIINDCKFDSCYTSVYSELKDLPIYKGSKVECTDVKGVYGATCFFSNTEILSIYNTQFTNNRINNNVSPCTLPHNFNSTIVVVDCKDTNLTDLTFDNDISVECDITVDFKGSAPTFYEKKKIAITHCCFKTKLTKDTIIVDVSKPIDTKYVGTFEIFLCSFSQPEFKLSFEDFEISPTLCEYNINVGCKYYPLIPSTGFSVSSVFTESNYFSYSRAFTSTDNFSPSIMFTQSNYYTKSELFTSSEDFTLSEMFSSSEPFSKSDTPTSSFFTPSKYFSSSNGFSLSLSFTDSNFFPSSSFAAIAFVEKGSKLSKGGIAGIIIACLVLLAIIILLLILFLKRKKSAFIPPEDDPMNIDGLDIPINMYD